MQCARFACVSRQETVGMSRRDQLMFDRARTQHGVLDHAELIGLGYTHSAIHRRVEQHGLIVLHPGVYLVGGAVRTREATWMAAVKAGGSDALLSHRPAITSWDVSRRAWTEVDVTTTRRVRIAGDVRFRMRAPLDPADRAVRDGIPITTCARTIVDMGSLLTAPQLANVIHEAQYRHGITTGEVRVSLARATGRVAVGLVERACALIDGGSVGTRSQLEDDFLALLQHARIRMPDINVRRQVGAERIELDATWPDVRFAVEIDGPGHARGRVTRADAERDGLLERAGWRLLRVRADDLRRRPDRVVAAVRFAVRRARKL